MTRNEPHAEMEIGRRDEIETERTGTLTVSAGVSTNQTENIQTTNGAMDIGGVKMILHGRKI